MVPPGTRSAQDRRLEVDPICNILGHARTDSVSSGRAWDAQASAYASSKLRERGISPPAFSLDPNQTYLIVIVSIAIAVP